MSTLAEKLRAAREHRVETGGHTFIYRRPTPVEWAADIRALGGDRAILKAIVGWESVTEHDLLGNEVAVPIKFDSDTAAEWLSDRIDLLNDIAADMIEKVNAHAQTIADNRKN